MDFRAFYFALDADKRKDFADRAGSTVGYLTLVAYRKKQIELGLADVLVKLADGAVTLRELPLTDRALLQDLIRSGKKAPKSEPAKAA